jgi:hypothetical protein
MSKHFINNTVVSKHFTDKTYKLLEKHWCTYRTPYQRLIHRLRRNQRAKWFEPLGIKLHDEIIVTLSEPNEHFRGFVKDFEIRADQRVVVLGVAGHFDNYRLRVDPQAAMRPTQPKWKKYR